MNGATAAELSFTAPCAHSASHRWIYAVTAALDPGELAGMAGAAERTAASAIMWNIAFPSGTRVIALLSLKSNPPLPLETPLLYVFGMSIDDSVSIKINGEHRRVPSGLTIAEMLGEIGL